MDAPGTNIEPPDYEPLDSPLRQKERRYHTPEDLWEGWSDDVRRCNDGGGGSQRDESNCARL